MIEAILNGACFTCGAVSDKGNNHDVFQVGRNTDPNGAFLMDRAAFKVSTMIAHMITVPD